MGYFDIGAFDARGDRAGRPGFSYGFDAVEVLNGYQAVIAGNFERTFADWLALLDHGHLVTATGNSDTHRLTGNVGGYPRNFVRVRDDRPAAVSSGDVASALRGHHAFFTTGPFLRLRAGGGDIGDLVPAPGGNVSVLVEVDAPPWIAVDRVTLYLNGRRIRGWTPSSRGSVVRVAERVELTLAGDGYAVLRAEGDQPLAPIVGDRDSYPLRPLAVTNPIFTNPIFFDADVDGAYHPVSPR
jgi:hypothetical protein